MTRARFSWVDLLALGVVGAAFGAFVGAVASPVFA